MKEIIIIILILLALISASFSQTTSDNPENFQGPSDSKTENTDLSNKCSDICLEKNEQGTCIKVEVRCDS